jgi:hypothetical protein
MKISILAMVLSLGAAASAGAQQSAGRQSTEIPAAYRPPKGMCRIWLKDVPPAQQPAPTDCASAVKNTPQNGRVIFGDTEEKKEKPKELPSSAKGFSGKTKTPPVIPPRKPPM